jgi:hypothetical protein
VHALPSSAHDVPDGRSTSAGHTALVPVQVSARSQTPADPRQVAPAFPGVFAHPTPGVQLSTVHGLPSSQLSGVPTQTPPWQVSTGVHTFSPSLHSVPSGAPAQVTVNRPWSTVAGI